VISSDNAEIGELKERLRQLDVERTAIQARIRGLEAAVRRQMIRDSSGSFRREALAHLG
jgi:transposase